jgi:hypothetical protein
MDKRHTHTMKPSSISRVQANELFRATGGTPHDIFNEETNKYDKYVRYSNGQNLGPFLKLNDFKKAAIDAYVHTFRVLPKTI